VVYGLSCPMDFPINIFIHPSIHPLDYGRFVPMHFRSRERNDHSEYVRSRERTCGRFVPGTKLPIVLTFVH